MALTLTLIVGREKKVDDLDGSFEYFFFFSRRKVEVKGPRCCTGVDDLDGHPVT